MSSLENRANIFFEIATIKKSIPKAWWDKLSQHPETALSTSTQNKYKNFLTMKYKDIYNKILLTNKASTKSAKYWGFKFGNYNIDWENTFCNIFSSKLIPRKISDFNWRVFYGVIPVENRLMLMRSSDGICKLCSNNLETMQHMFLDCEKLGDIWWRIEYLIRKHLKQVVCITYQTIILGVDPENTDPELTNMFIFISKWEIWKHRNMFLFENELIYYTSLYATITTGTFTSIAIYL